MNGARTNRIAGHRGGPVGVAAAGASRGEGADAGESSKPGSGGAARQRVEPRPGVLAWRYNVDPVAARAAPRGGLEGAGSDVLPTGAEIVAEYLRPLAALPGIAPHVRLARGSSPWRRAGVRQDEDADVTRARSSSASAHRRERRRCWCARSSTASGTYGVRIAGATAPATARPASAPTSSPAFDVLGIDRRATPAGTTLVVAAGTPRSTRFLDLTELAADRRRRRSRGPCDGRDVRSDVRRRCGGCAAGAWESRADARARRCRSHSPGDRRPRRGAAAAGAQGDVSTRTGGRTAPSTRSSGATDSGRTSRCSASFASISTPRPREPARPRAADRSEPAQLRHGQAHGRGRARASGTGFL